MHPRKHARHIADRRHCFPPIAKPKCRTKSAELQSSLAPGPPFLDPSTNDYVSFASFPSVSSYSVLQHNLAEEKKQ